MDDSERRFHHETAVALFNRCWELIDAGERTSDDEADEDSRQAIAGQLDSVPEASQPG